MDSGAVVGNREEVIEDHDRVFHPSGGEMLTKQSERDLTDVNLIMDSWVHAGAAVAGHFNPAEGAYGDFSSGIDYHEALSRVKDAEASFMELPAKVRGHVENDPGKFLDMVFDPERRDELERLGLVDSLVSSEAGASVAGDAPVAGTADVEETPAKSTGGDDSSDAPRGSTKGDDPAGGLFD